MAVNLLASLVFLSALPWLLAHYGLMGAGIQALGQSIVASGLLVLLVWRSSLER
jgi:nucleoside permease NupC